MLVFLQKSHVPAILWFPNVLATMLQWRTNRLIQVHTSLSQTHMCRAGTWMYMHIRWTWTLISTSYKVVINPSIHSKWKIKCLDNTSWNCPIINFLKKHSVVLKLYTDMDEQWHLYCCSEGTQMHPEINHILYQHFLYKITQVKYSSALSLLDVTEYKPAQPFTNILKWMCKKWLQVIEQTVK